MRGNVSRFKVLTAAGALVAVVSLGACSTSANPAAAGSDTPLDEAVAQELPRHAPAAQELPDDRVASAVKTDGCMLRTRLFLFPTIAWPLPGRPHAMLLVQALADTLMTQQERT